VDLSHRRGGGSSRGRLTTNDLELFVSSMPEREKERGKRIRHPSPMRNSKGEVVDRE